MIIEIHCPYCNELNRYTSAWSHIAAPCPRRIVRGGRVELCSSFYGCGQFFARFKGGVARKLTRAESTRFRKSKYYPQAVKAQKSAREQQLVSV
jgi:hypothetical protein